MHLKAVESMDLLLRLDIACAPHADDEYRQGLFERIKERGTVGQRRRTTLEIVPDETRIHLIGGLLERHGMAWPKSAYWVRWLAERGVDQETAIERHREFIRGVNDDPRWRSIEDFEVTREVFENGGINQGHTEQIGDDNHGQWSPV